MFRSRAPALVLLALLLAAPTLADWNPEMPAKWVQFPDLTPMGIDVNASTPMDFILADDFECTETGPITGIHVWGSWYQDHFPYWEWPEGVTFILSIHADIPATAQDYSRPGDVLWFKAFSPGEFTAQVWQDDINEGWMNPPDEYEFPGDHVCWQYNFYIDSTEAFVQQGTPEVPVVYWLDLKAIPEDQEAWFGWKTSLDHWNDDAVWGIGAEPYLGPWYELVYPPNHEMAGQSIDLAFVIAGEEEPELYDFGDAPDAVGALGYPTLLANTGAHHVIVPNIFMGGSVDDEPNGQPDPVALGDDNDGNDDEDGVVFTSPLVQGQPATVDITVSVDGYIDAWLDFNIDGDWMESDEIIMPTVNVVAGLNNMTFMVPPTAVPGSTFARFRYTTYGGVPFDGLANDGEVEDYEVDILPALLDMKWEQPPDLTVMGIDVDASPYAGREYILADDFLCDRISHITDVRIWGSWRDDYMPDGVPYAVDFTLSLHADIPAEHNPLGYSMPGEVLWTRDFQAGDFETFIWMDGILEGWMDPPTDYHFPGDTICWAYDFTIPVEEAFLQMGTPEEPVVYWLDVKAQPLDPQSYWGWKTSEVHWNDDAVWGNGFEPYPGPWEELIYPPGHNMEGQSIDLAFALADSVPDEVLDWGDAPDDPTGLPGYPTYDFNNGANHVVVPGIFLGNLIDAEGNGQPDATATGDDLAGLADEDGVTFTSPMYPGYAASVDIVASVPGFVDMWIDFGVDQSWFEADDYVLISEPVNPGTNSFTFNVPASALAGSFTFARVRYSTTGGLPPDGPAPDGEVEDYQILITDQYVMKWIQQPDLTPMGIDVAACVSHAGDDYLLADDFLCTRTGPLTDFWVWGSWLNDYLPHGENPRAVRFVLSIHADIPAGVVEEWSMPGDVLWWHEFAPGDFEVELFAGDIDEGFMYPPDMYIFPGDHQCWLYKFHVPPLRAFKQEGSEQQPIVYWLDLKAYPEDPEAQFGWKTSVDHWNDDATWTVGEEPYFGPWFELRYPPGHELFGLSIDLAFAVMEDVITTVPEEGPPERVGLYQNVPNPFNPRTEIKYDMPAGGGHVRLVIFDVMGRQVRTLVDGVVAEGTRTAVWDGLDDDGQALPTGVYFANIYADNVRQTVKMVLMR